MHQRGARNTEGELRGERSRIATPRKKKRWCRRCLYRNVVGYRFSSARVVEQARIGSQKRVAKATARRFAGDRCRLSLEPHS